MKVKLSKAHKAFLEEPFGIGTQLVKGMIEEYEEELEQVKAAILGFLEKLSYQHGNLTQKDGYYTMYENGKIWVYSPMCRMVRRFQHRLFQRNIYVPLDIQKCLHFEMLLSIYNHTIPRIYGRQWEAYKETGNIDINDEDLRFASIIYEAVVYWQDYFFGRMLQDTWQNAENEIQPRRRTSKAADEFEALPKEFTADDVAKMFAIERETARKRIQRWINGGYVRVNSTGKPVVYEKCVTAIVV